MRLAGSDMNVSVERATQSFLRTLIGKRAHFRGSLSHRHRQTGDGICLREEPLGRTDPPDSGRWTRIASGRLFEFTVDGRRIAIAAKRKFTPPFSACINLSYIRHKAYSPITRASLKFPHRHANACLKKTGPAQRDGNSPPPEKHT